MRRSRNETGAAAVEFALVVPVLVLLVVGIMSFGRAYNVQIELTAAAREGARTLAIQQDPAAALTRTQQAAPSLDPGLMQVTTSSECGPNAPDAATATVTVTYPLELLYGMGDIELTGKGVMRCGG